MKKVGIVYTSKYGHTKQYADWLVESLGKNDADAVNVASFNPTQLLAYKLIIFASGVYSDKLPIMDFIKKNMTGISIAKTMVMAVSWYTNDSEEAVKKLTEENYPDQFKGKVPMFVVNSGIDMKKIPVVDKGKLMASKLIIERRDDRTNDDINILSIMKGYFDPTSEENLASIKAAIEEFFNPKKKEEPKPEVKAEVKTEPAPKPVVPTPVPVVETPKPEPEPKPEPQPQRVMDASEMQSDLDALSSLENAFKNLKAPKTAPRVTTPPPAPEPKPEPVVEVKPEPKPEPVVEVKPEPKPEPVVEVKPEPKPEPVVEVKPEPKPAPKRTEVEKEVASSVKSALAALNGGSAGYNPAPAFEDIGEETVSSVRNIDISFDMDEKPEIAENDIPVIAADIDLSAETDMSWDSVTNKEPEIKEEPAPVVEAPKPEPVQEAVPEVKEEPKKSNSYMELFAKRRKKVEEPTPEVKAEPVPEIKSEPIPEPVAEIKAEPIPEPVAEVKPAPIERPKPTEHVASVDMLSEFDFISGTAPSEPVAPAPVPSASVSSTDTMDVYDFMEDSKPKASSRVLNAVQDLAKAKAEAEKEAAKAAAAKEAKEIPEEAPAADNSFIEKMKQDMAALAAESQIEIEHQNVPENSSDEEEIDGFTFSNDIDYDLGAIEIDTPPIGAVSLETIHTFDDFEEKKRDTDLNLKKLQEEINASIETNKAYKEKMNNRYAKKPKAEAHNPFAVQFEEDESKSKKKKKKDAEPKRLEDPIDPDIFFSRPSKKGNDDYMMSDTMPEIKFKRR